MDKKNVRDSFVEELQSIFEKPINADTRFREDLNAASFHYLGIMCVIEELTGETISFSELKACDTVSDMLDLIDSQV